MKTKTFQKPFGLEKLLTSKVTPVVVSVCYTIIMLWYLAHEQYDNVYLCLAAIPVIVLAQILLFRKIWLVYALIFTVPLSIRLELGGGFAAAFPSEPLLLMLACLFVVRLVMVPTLHKKVLYHPITITLLIDTLWLIVATLNSSNIEVSVKRIVIRILFILVCYLMFSRWFEHRKNIIKAVLLYCLGLLPVILLTLNKHAAWDFATNVSFTIPQPYFADHTVYGAAIAFVIPFMVTMVYHAKDFGLIGWQRLLMAGILIVLIFGEIFAYSRASWISLIAAGIFAVMLRFKVRIRTLLLLIGSIAVIGIAFSDAILESVRQNEAVSNQGDITTHFQSVTNLSTDASNLERINRWVSAYLMFEERPITGFGPGTYQFEYAKYQLTHMKTYISTNHGNRGNAHSEYLTYLSEAGLPGLLTFLAWIFATLGTGMRIIYRTKDALIKRLATGIFLGLITFFVHGLFNSFIDQDKMAVLVFGSLAALVALEAFHLKKTPTGATSPQSSA